MYKTHGTGVHPLCHAVFSADPDGCALSMRGGSVLEQGGPDPPFFVAVEKKPAGEVRRFHGAAVHQPRREC